HEAHHVTKRDAPSGTALLLRDAMTAAGYDRPVDISATRAGAIPGTHTVGFDGPSDTIELTHTARDRRGFASGALLAAQWIQGRRGWYTMTDVLSYIFMRIPFTGVGTALVTPFRKDGSIDETAVRALVRRQIDSGVHFVSPIGTTGEAPTLSHAERLRVVELVVQETNGKVPVLAGA